MTGGFGLRMKLNPHRRGRLPAWLLALALAALAATTMTDAQEAPPVRTLTVADCLALAEEQAFALANARHDEAIAGERIRQVRADALPTLEGDARYTWQDDPVTFPGMEGAAQDESYHAGLTAEQLLYAGGSVRAALKAASHYRDAAQAQAAQVRQRILRDVGQQFFAVLFAEEAAGVAAESLRVLEAFEAQTRSRAGRGMATEFEWLTAQVRVANERPVKNSADNALALARARLRTLLVLPDDAFALDGRLTAPTNDAAMEVVYAAALQRRPDLAAAEAQIGLYEASVRHAGSAYLPELRAFTSYAGDRPNMYDPTAEEWRWDWQAGASASWSFFDGGLRRSKVAEARLDLAKAHTDRDEQRQTIRYEVEEACLNLGNARENLRGAAESVALAERALAIARTRVEQGMATYLELTDSNVALSRARLQRLAALKNCRQAWIDVQYAAGGDVAGAAREEGFEHE